jgi:hypothetical protein
MIYLIICAFLQGLAKACSDSIISFKWYSSYWSRFNVNGYFGISNNQKNAWSFNPLLNWLLRNPLVFLADFWHGANTIQIISQIASLYFALSLPIDMNQIWYIVIGYWLLRTSTFHIFYTYIFLKKEILK